MKKFLLTLPLITVISACVTTPTTSTTNEVASPATVDNNWTASLVPQKLVLRSCIIADKNIQSIRYIETKDNTTSLIVENKNGDLLNCEVNATTHKVIKIVPFTDNLPVNLGQFYPVGKKTPPQCANKLTLQDEAGRLMGTICN